MQPYPLALKEFENESDVIEIIAIDLEQFKNAIRSHQSGEFIDCGRNIIKVTKKFEDLYLYYNISHDNMEKLMGKLDEFENVIKEIKSESERLYFKKEPENL